MENKENNYIEKLLEKGKNKIKKVDDSFIGHMNGFDLFFI